MAEQASPQEQQVAEIQEQDNGKKSRSNLTKQFQGQDGLKRQVTFYSTNKNAPEDEQVQEEYHLEVEFSDLNDAVNAGTRYVVWLMQREARSGNLSSGRTYTVDSKGRYVLSMEEQVERMTPEEIQRMKQLIALAEKQKAEQESAQAAAAKKGAKK